MSSSTNHRLFVQAELTWFLLGLLVSTPVFATDYFVRAEGDDGASGRSRKAAWRSIARVNEVELQPGDRVLFQAGRCFAGNLRLTAEDAGTAVSPVVIGSTGHGRATILAGASTGISVENAGGVVIEDLIIQGSGRTNNTGYGVACDNTLPSGERLEHLSIQNVEVSSFGRFGIWVSGERAGFAHVRITDCAMHDNLRGGMEVAGRLPYDATNYAHADVLVSRCRAFDNTGDPARLDNHSGSGMVLYQVDGGLFDECEAWNNGAECRAKGGGPVGIWTCASRRVVIQHCESFANRTSAADGGGFDLDGGCVDCVLQYNYSHDNDGPGLMVYSYPYASHTDRGSVVRFNISENDSRKSRTYAGLWLRTDGPRITGVQVYNNTVVIGPWADQAVMVHGNEVEASLRNNIFVSRGTAVPLRVSQPHARLRFENNLYWQDDGPLQVVWGDQTFADLGEWRVTTGQEVVGGKATGFAQSPFLTSHPAGAKAGERIGLRELRAFRPAARSPSTTAGLNLQELFGLDPGGRDFAGRRLPWSGQLPLGAFRGR